VAQFIVVDFFIYIDHRLEHLIKPLYRNSHKSHHRFINPKLLDAFTGSIMDTLMLILIPLFVTAHVLPHMGVDVTNWDFIVFGTLYANQVRMYVRCGDYVML